MPGSEADDDATGPVPHPLDRPWVHPSELVAGSRPPIRGSGAGDRAANRGAGSWRRDLAMSVAAGTLGAVATVGVLGLVGAFEADPSRSETATRFSSSVTTSTDAAALAAQVAPGIVAVITTSAGREERGSGVAVGAHQVVTTVAVTPVAPVPSGGENVTGSETDRRRIEICTADGRRHPATEIGRDPVTGLVLLRASTLEVQPAAFAAPIAVRAGDWVVAVGRSATSGPWVSSGVVTALGGWMSDDSGANHAGMITTSAGLATEARGGALVDRRGQVVGILAATGSAPTRTAAVPSDMLRDVADQLAATGQASHGALGVEASDTADRGATIIAITPTSAAATAGLRVGDRIVALDSARIADTADLVGELRRRRSGVHLRITVVRGARSVQLAAVLDDAAGLPVTAKESDGPVIVATPSETAALTPLTLAGS